VLPFSTFPLVLVVFSPFHSFFLSFFLSFGGQVMVVAKTPDALAFLAAAFKGRRVSKAYLAVAVGLPQPNEPRNGPSYATTATAPAMDKALGAAWAPPLPETWADAGKLPEVCAIMPQRLNIYIFFRRT
jgi:hypothetical protein